jgi:histone-binding protein RBBP4
MFLVMNPLCSARYQPQNANIVATKCPKGDLLVFDLSVHPAKPVGSECKPLLRLLGHDEEGYGLAWSNLEPGKILSGSDDCKVCLWDTAAAPSKGNSLNALHCYDSHTAVVEDVAWHAHHKEVFASVGDDKRLLLYAACFPQCCEGFSPV